MKKNLLKTMCLAAVATLALASCNQSNPQADAQAEAKQTAPTELKIAYVEVDSIMTQYKFCKDYSLILQKKGQNIQNTLAAKQQQLQAAAANFEKKLQNNAFTSREEAARVQAAIQRQQQDLQELQARLGNELDAETAKYNVALRDSLQHFLKDYNKSKKYDLILSKAGDNILYAEKRHDITQDVINGLNKRYKSTLKKSAEK